MYRNKVLNLRIDFRWVLFAGLICLSGAVGYYTGSHLEIGGHHSKRTNRFAGLLLERDRGAEGSGASGKVKRAVLDLKIRGPASMATLSDKRAFADILEELAAEDPVYCLKAFSELPRSFVEFDVLAAGARMALRRALSSLWIEEKSNALSAFDDIFAGGVHRKVALDVLAEVICSDDPSEGLEVIENRSLRDGVIDLWAGTDGNSAAGWVLINAKEGAQVNVGEFNRAIQSWAKNEFAEAFRFANETVEQRVRIPALKGLLRFGRDQKLPIEALSQAAKAIEELPASGLKSYALNNLAERWAHMDPNKALNWINAQEDDGTKQMLMKHAREGLLEHSPEKIWGMLDGEGSVEGRISLMVPYMQSRASKIGYEETVRWIKNLPRRYAATSPALLATAYSDWARSNPVDVAQSIKDVGRLDTELDARVWRTVLRSVDYRGSLEEVVLVSEIFESLDQDRRLAINEYIDSSESKFMENGVVDMID